MKLCLLLYIAHLPWSQSYATRGMPQPNPSPRALPQKPQPQEPLQECGYIERLRDATDGERPQKPQGDQFDIFDWRLTKELHEVEAGNIITSPVSLKVVLAMLYEGARGATAHEIGGALDLSSNATERRQSRRRFSAILKSLQTSEGEYEIKVGTHAFIDQKAEVNRNYQCKLKTFYNSDIVKVDFTNPSAAVKVINNWAKNVTEGHIQSLISESEAQTNTVMLLLNAVYFKGQWEIPFPVNQTQPGTFYLNDQKMVKVPFMNVVDKFGYYDLPALKAHLVELPYKGNKFSMYVLLPYNKTGLDNVAAALGPQRSLKGVISNMMPTLVNLTMPKFEFVYTTKLRSTLEKLGIKTMFTSSAELDDIARTKTGDLVVSNVLQKAGISVTEAGTVAYAATAVDLGNKFGGSEEMIDFTIDRPFMFFIEDTRLNTTVFVGKVTNPDLAKVVSAPQEPPAPTTAEKPTAETDAGISDRFNENGHYGNGNRPSSTQTVEQTTKTAFNFFDGELLQAVGREIQGNFVISPASIKTLLGLMLEAADGDTLDDLKFTLRLTNNNQQNRQLMQSLQTVLQKVNTSQVVVDSETNVFLSKDHTFNSSYARTISDVYNAGVDNIDFKSPESAANLINSWVRTQTRGKIPSVVDAGALDPKTLTVLINTVYFDAKWKEEFLFRDTTEECFYSEPDYTCNKVYMMSREADLNYKFDKDLSSHVIQIPYQDERFSMVLVVPAARNGIRRIARDVNKLVFPALLNKTKITEVHLKLPRFSVEFGADVKMILNKMGLGSLFTDEAKIPFMINNQQGRISAMMHKAKIDVNEKGTVAAAATGASVVPLISGDPPAFVTADHPFYYFIYEMESGSVLFSGRVSSLDGKPGAGQEMYEVDNLAPLSGGDPGKPSRAPVNYRPAAPIRPSRPSSSNAQKPNFLGSENHPYSIESQPQSPPSSNPSNPILYPTDQDLQGAEYLSKYGKDHYSRNFRSSRRSSLW